MTVSDCKIDQNVPRRRAQTRLLVARKVVPTLMDDRINAGLFGGGGLGRATQAIPKLTILALGALELVLEPLVEAPSPKCVGEGLGNKHTLISNLTT